MPYILAVIAFVILSLLDGCSSAQDLVILKPFRGISRIDEAISKNRQINSPAFSYVHSVTRSIIGDSGATCIVVCRAEGRSSVVITIASLSSCIAYKPLHHVSHTRNNW